MAVIGSGPAGFYTAYKVMSKIEDAVVDMYEQLPVPYGLVRFGVAPDHPEVKVSRSPSLNSPHLPTSTYTNTPQNCQDKFNEVASSPRFNFIGNTHIGSSPTSLPLSLLAPHYDAILFAYGASKDRTLGIQGEDTLSGIYSARAFVGWYNGLPEYADLKPDLQAGEEALVIGQGNVALDVARILLSDVAALKSTDITETAIEALQRSRVKRVRIVGRRGAMQAAFTIKEVRELTQLPNVAFHPLSDEVLPPTEMKLERAKKRIVDVLRKARAASLEPEKAERSWSLDFGLSPTSFNASLGSNQLSSTTFEKTKLLDPWNPSSGVESTGQHLTLPSQLAFRSIGYKSEPLPGMEDLGVVFDEKRGIIPNDISGRVLGPDGEAVRGLYCAGWVKRGPTGVIAGTMADGFGTAEGIVGDWGSGRLGGDEGVKGGWEAIREEAKKRGCRRVTWEDWCKIDEFEKERGEERGKVRSKIARVEEMLRVLD